MKQHLSDPVIDESPRSAAPHLGRALAMTPHGLVAFYMEMQKQYQDRLI